MDRQFSRAADRGLRLSQSRAETGHRAGGQTHPAAQQNLPADSHWQGGHQSKSPHTKCFTVLADGRDYVKIMPRCKKCSILSIAVKIVRFYLENVLKFQK